MPSEEGSSEEGSGGYSSTIVIVVQGDVQGNVMSSIVNNNDGSLQHRGMSGGLDACQSSTVATPWYDSLIYLSRC